MCLIVVRTLSTTYALEAGIGCEYQCLSLVKMDGTTLPPNPLTRHEALSVARIHANHYFEGDWDFPLSFKLYLITLFNFTEANVLLGRYTSWRKSKLTVELYMILNIIVALLHEVYYVIIQIILNLLVF